jgi:DNA invertase Pin-like site-specific DNA recombinase/DNA-binding transcriptional MerR regulator
MKAKALIPAVAYVRKSTKGERKGRERQEKSLPQQAMEIDKLAEGRYRIVGRYSDPGISGWKMGAQRPDFQRLLDRAQQAHDFEAILVDNLDRFSRASVDEVQEVALQLKRAGVKQIVSAAQGVFDLGRTGSDIGEILRFVVAVWSSHEYSRQLSRRIALAKRNGAVEGRRTGGNAPYGLKNDGKGGLVAGDAKEVKTVRRIFTEFVNEARSLSAITARLNAGNIPSPQGGRWSCRTIAQLVRRTAYRGDFRFNVVAAGQFFRIDAKGEVVESSEIESPGRVFEKTAVYEPIIDPKLFDKAQAKLQRLSQNRSQRKSQYALSGILRCDNCGEVMFGRMDRSAVTYQCSSSATHGKGSCKAFTIRESRILPFVMRRLGQKIKNVYEMLTRPPEAIANPRKAERERKAHLQRERDSLAKRIARAEDNLMASEDVRTRKSLDQRLTALRDELEALDKQLAENKPAAIEGYSKEEAEAINAWWDEFLAKAVGVPVKGEVGLVAATFFQDPLAEERMILLDPRVVNQALRELGAEVHLLWETEQYKTSGGIARNRHTLVRRQFQLGRQKGSISGTCLVNSSLLAVIKQIPSLGRVDVAFDGVELPMKENPK